MRILILTHYWNPHRGGVETVAHEQARLLMRRGHDVSVVTSRLRGDPAVSEGGGFPVYRVTAANVLEHFGVPYPLFSRRLPVLLDWLVPQHDIVLVHSHTFLSSVAGVFTARHHRRPVVLLQHNPFVRFRFPWNIVERGADLLLGRYTLRTADKLLAVSEHTGRYVESLVPSRCIAVLRNGVDTRRFSPTSSRNAQLTIRDRLGLPRAAFIALTVRRLAFRNGVDLLIEASVRLKHDRSIFTVIGGNGPEKAKLERIVQKERLSNVLLVGAIDDELLPDFYRAADVFILPTRTGEGFGLAMLEAFASGVPVIATRTGGHEELLCGERAGILVPVAEPGVLADAILRLQREPELVACMGREARAIAETLDWEVNVDTLEGVLSQSAARRSVAVPVG